MNHPAKIRLTADLSVEVAEGLKELAANQGITISQALARAISTEALLVERRRQGAKVVLDENGRLSELVFPR